MTSLGKKFWPVLAVLTALISAISGSAYAQTYTNTSTQNFNSSTNCGGGEFTRTFTVPPADDVVIGDLDVGFFAQHPWRGDIRVDLTSPGPGPVTVRLIEEDTSGAGNDDNYNILMDQAAGTLINTGAHDNADSLVPAPPPYENLVRPNNSLDAFNGRNSAGTWTLTMCDDYPSSDNGQFRRADLIISAATDADLSLAITASDNTPDESTNVVLTYTINNGGIPATGVSADITLPAGLSYVSDNGSGAYNNGTGLWTVPGTIAGGGSASLQITAFVLTTGPYNTSAEVETSDQTDPDSTPGNGITSEDDYDSLTLAPVAPPIPPLMCGAAASSVLDWDAVSWPAASMNNSYTVDGELINLAYSDPNSAIINYAAAGGTGPVESTYYTGGISPADTVLAVVADQPNQAGTVDLTISLGTAGIGVDQFQMSIFDVDFGASQFHDRLVVTASLGGSSVPVTLTGSANNTVTGNIAQGDTATGNTSSGANVRINVAAKVDSVTITYGNGSGAPTNPGIQGIGYHKVFFCPPTTAELTANKTTEIYDPLSEGLYAVPGNDVIYTIEFTNIGTGPTDTDSVILIDSMPPEIDFYNGDIDDGGPETTPVIGIDNGSSLTWNYGADIGYWNGPVKPADFSGCTYTPAAGYDSTVTYICFNPSGAMQHGDPDPSFALKFRARIK